MPINTDALKSWPFVATVLTAAAVWLTALIGNTVPNKDAYIVTGAVAGLYALARGVAKFNGPVKSVTNTTEFYVVLIGAAVVTLGAFHGHMGAGLWTTLMGFLTFATTIAHALSSPAVAARR